MLRLKRKHKINFPSITELLPHSMQLSPVIADDDELSQAIANDPIDHDNRWTLTERPETGQLEQYWDNVVADIKSDPSWVDFSND